MWRLGETGCPAWVEEEVEDTKGTEDGKEVTVEEVIGEEVTAEDGEEAAVVEAHCAKCEP